jgi:hypothetical protein
MRAVSSRVDCRRFEEQGNLDCHDEAPFEKRRNRFSGTGWIGIGVPPLVLGAVPMRRGERWARLLTPALFFLFYVSTLLATIAVMNGTPATPPWYGNAVACVATVLGVGADRPWRVPS